MPDDGLAAKKAARYMTNACMASQSQLNGKTESASAEVNDGIYIFVMAHESVRWLDTKLWLKRGLLVIGIATTSTMMKERRDSVSNVWEP
jgi:hypothetical protein